MTDLVPENLETLKELLSESTAAILAGSLFPSVTAQELISFLRGDSGMSRRTYDDQEDSSGKREIRMGNMIIQVETIPSEIPPSSTGTVPGAWEWAYREVFGMEPYGKGRAIRLPNKKMAEKARSTLNGLSCLRDRGKKDRAGRRKLEWPWRVTTRTYPDDPDNPDAPVTVKFWIVSREDD